MTLMLLTTLVPILTIFAVIVIGGLIVWAITTYIPMNPAFKKIFVIVAIIVLILWLLHVFNVWHYISSVTV